ncbi:hypothetical protein KsCSTR_11330 [Candidatus Kuenenia stuttgartiensis]|nr:hypothetical protein KsCSTR_11330 [Candidatus Kuenenia stuttgartiensis]
MAKEAYFSKNISKLPLLNYFTNSMKTHDVMKNRLKIDVNKKKNQIGRRMIA